MGGKCSKDYKHCGFALANTVSMGCLYDFDRYLFISIFFILKLSFGYASFFGCSLQGFVNSNLILGPHLCGAASSHIDGPTTAGLPLSYELLAVAVNEPHALGCDL
jgi:hypothetical protein